MALAIPALSDFGDSRGPILLDPDTNSTLNKPVIFDNYIPTGVSRFNYVVVQMSVQVNQPNGLGVCSSLNALSASFKVNAVNNSGSTSQQVDKAAINGVMDLFQAQLADTNLTIPAAKPPI